MFMGTLGERASRRLLESHEIMQDIIMEEPPELLVTRRSRRSTAGNRMEAALAEMALDDASRDLDDDNDFVNDKDEQDMFESDFESTDEEAAQDGAEIGDKDVHEEEKRERRAARSRLEKATAAAHAKNTMTFNPQASMSQINVKPKPKRRVSLGVAVDVETGEVLGPETVIVNKKKRHSQRKHTVLNTSATVTRQKQSEEKKAATPKKAKTTTRSFTQMELIAKALDNEEGNIVQHRDYLKIEEEKRKRARVVRLTTDGPLLRWVSKSEEVKVVVQPPPPAPFVAPTQANYNPYIYGSYAQFAYPLSNTQTQPIPSMAQSPPILPVVQAGPQSQAVPVSPSVTSSATTISTVPGASVQQPNALPQSPTSSMTSTFQYQVFPYTTQSSTSSPAMLPPQEVRCETVTKNYLVHELGQFDGAPKPRWVDTMEAMFGDHVKWDQLKVYVGKGRPLSRPKQTCPITGKEALYLDPRTGVPFADAYAFQTLTRILRHEYIWDTALGCYVGVENNVPSSS